VVAARAVSFDEKKVDAILSEFNQCELPGAALGIALNGRPLYRKGFGLASMELPIALAPTTRMRMASVTKHFACLAYLLLCEEGRAAIDDPIGAYLPELHPVASRVTAREIMGNVSGLRDVHDICWQFGGLGSSTTSAELLSLYRDIDDVNAEPGVAWIYNNGGFLLLSAVIERITDEPLEEVLTRRIFQPIGMYESTLVRFDTDFACRGASMHHVRTAGGFSKSYFGTEWAAEGGMVSTVDDMLRWLRHMDAPTVGTAATWQLMKEPQVLANGTSTGYGLGLISDTYRGARTLYHPGGWIGGSAQMLKVPDAGLDVVIIMNRDDAWAIDFADRVLDACLRDLTPRNEHLAPLASGTFRSPTSGRVIQLIAREGRQIASVDGMDMPIESDRDGVLWPSSIFRYVKQGIRLLGDPAMPSSLRLSDFGSLDELVREELLEEHIIEGRYVSDSTGTEAETRQTKRGPQLLMWGRFGSICYPLECLCGSVWRAKAASQIFLGGILSFDDAGAVLRFSSYRTRALIFRRAA
jgi:D-aminopeptidase